MTRRPAHQDIDKEIHDSGEDLGDPPYGALINEAWAAIGASLARVLEMEQRSDLCSLPGQIRGSDGSITSTTRPSSAVIT